MLFVMNMNVYLERCFLFAGTVGEPFYTLTMFLVVLLSDVWRKYLNRTIPSVETFSFVVDRTMLATNHEDMFDAFMRTSLFDKLAGAITNFNKSVYVRLKGKKNQHPIVDNIPLQSATSAKVIGQLWM